MKSLSMHLTDRCNNSCKFCIVNSHQNKAEAVDKKIIFNFLRENAGQGYESVNIHGGEATILPELIEILDMIREFGYPTVSLQTNGRKLSDIDYAKEVASRGVDLFVISVHGKEPETHDFCTGVPESFVEAIQGIRNVKSLGKKVRTNTVVCIQNYHSMIDIVKFIAGLKVDHINISAIHPAGKAFKNFFQVTPKLSDIVPEVQKAIDALINTNTDITITLEGFPPCILGDYWKYMINWEEINFKLLFHNVVMPNYNDFMEKKTREQGPPCKGCSYQKKCGGVYKEYIYYRGWEEFTAIS
jgi:MoaA/NifB/PqqE/SkfB family radical SAM enzyme